MTDATQGYGQQDPSDSASEFNSYAFQIAQALARVSTVKIVQVKAVDTGKKTVDIQIAVNQSDGQGNATPHGVISAVPYIWAMGGKNAFEIDPAVGDLGVMVVCDRDVSAVKAAKAIANIGSYRKFDATDGIYLFGLPGLAADAPEQWVKFTDGGIEIKDKNANAIETNSDGISINGVVFNRQGQVAGNLPVTGALQLAGTITALAGGDYGANFRTTGNITSTATITGTNVAGQNVSEGSIRLGTHHHTAQGATSPTTGPQP